MAAGRVWAYRRCSLEFLGVAGVFRRVLVGATSRQRCPPEVLLGKFADRYACVFTSGATASLKLVADCFPWREGSSFACVADSHDSAWGMGEVAVETGRMLDVSTHRACESGAIYCVDMIVSCACSEMVFLQPNTKMADRRGGGPGVA